MRQSPLPTVDARVLNAPRRGPRQALSLAPVPRGHEVPTPQPVARCASGPLLVDVGARVASVREREAALDHPGVQVLAARAAHRDDAPVAVDVPFLARDRPPADALSQAARRALAAAPARSARVTSLGALGRVDAVKPNALAGERERIAVDHPGTP